MPPKQKPVEAVEETFAKDEKVYCYQQMGGGGRLYEAKVRDTKTEDGTTVYYIHYHGWNSRQDEWVNVERLRKDTEENRRACDEAQERDKSLKKSKSKGKRKSTKKDDEGSNSRASTPTVDSLSKSGPSSAKRKAGRPDPNVETEEQFRDRKEIHIDVPKELQKLLVDDWDQITRNYKLLTFPARVTVDDVIRQYVASREQMPNKKKMALFVESAKAVQDYFDVLLGTQLLYKFERPQYKQILEREPKGGADFLPSKSYGLVHLLRLFVRLGSNLAMTSWSEKDLSNILTHVADLIKFVNENHTQWLDINQDYETAPPEYQKAAWV